MAELARLTSLSQSLTSFSACVVCTTGMYRRDVYTILEDLPIQLKDLATNVEAHDQDQEIHRRTATSHVAAFNLLNHILHWVLKDSWITGIRIFADPIGFTEKLREYQAELKMVSQGFETRYGQLARDDGQQTLQQQYWAMYTYASSQASIDKRLATIEEKLSKVTLAQDRTVGSPLYHHMRSIDSRKYKARQSLSDHSHLI